MIVYRIEYEDRLGPYGTVWHPTTLREKLANILLNKHSGAKIAIYEVDEITEDGRQCVFEFDKAKLIKKVRITASNKRMCV
jgi:hypothetical protein